jgi:hypothetical protein
VLRILAALLLARLVSQFAGVDLLAAEVCDEPCEDSREQGDCSPSCRDCVCCPHKRVVTLMAQAEPAPSLGRALAFAPAVEPVTIAPPAEIMRVPKPPADA